MAVHTRGFGGLTVLGVLVVCGGVCGPAALCHGQVASALLREGQLLGAETVTALNNTAVNHVGGYAVTVNTAGTGTLSHAWGNLGGGPGAILRSEGIFGAFTQTAYETFFGIGTSSVCYGPTCSRGTQTGLDCVWVNDTPIAVESDGHPLIFGQFWSFASRPGVTSNGTAWFAGGVRLTSTGATSNRGLFTGGTDGNSVVLLGGTTVPGYIEPLSMTLSQAFNFRVSGDGNHYVTDVVLTAPAATQSGVVLDGSAAMAGGSVVRQGTVVPVSVGGNGTEAYANFDFFGITDAGDWMVTGDTNLATTTLDEIVMINGQIVMREGAVIGADTIQGDIEGAYMNNNGDWAAIWDIAANTREALIVNGQVVLRETDLVDWNGDGTADAGHALTDFTGISSLTLSDRAAGFVNAYFIADIITPTGTLESFFRLPVFVGFETGDTNCDGVLNAADCEAFQLALIDLPAYEAAHPGCSADINGDDVVDSFDIEAFCGVTGLTCDLCGGPECPCNWDGVDGLNSTDFFAFLDDFFDGDADFNNSGTTNSDDFFEYLDCFFDGCAG